MFAGCGSNAADPAGADGMTQEKPPEAKRDPEAPFPALAALREALIAAEDRRIAEAGQRRLSDE